MCMVFGKCSLTALSPTVIVISFGPNHHSMSFLEAHVTFRLSVEGQTISPIWYLGQLIYVCLLGLSFDLVPSLDWLLFELMCSVL
jgi:hypothetical protein